MKGRSELQRTGERTRAFIFRHSSTIGRICVVDSLSNQEPVGSSYGNCNDRYSRVLVPRRAAVFNTSWRSFRLSYKRVVHHDIKAIGLSDLWNF